MEKVESLVLPIRVSLLFLQRLWLELALLLVRELLLVLKLIGLY